MKICIDCKLEKPLADFCDTYDKGYVYKKPHCKKCEGIRSRIYRQTDAYKRWRDKNRLRRRHEQNLFQLMRKNRVPSWVNIEELLEIYLNCPDGYEVDHVIPIHGDIVSGLHVPWNLQYLTKVDNARKGKQLVI